MPLLQISADPGRMLFHQFSEDEPLKHSKNQDGQQTIAHREIGRIGQQTNAQDIDPCRAPHQTGQKQQSIPFYLHHLSPLL